MKISLVLIVLVSITECFIPSRTFYFFLDLALKDGEIDLGKVSESLVHEEILRRGVIASVAQFFIDKPYPKSNVSLEKLPLYYKNIRVLYHDYYGVWMCIIQLDTLLKMVLEPSVANVDVDLATKDLPYAHFDAETFIKSNKRVIVFTERIYTALAKKDYLAAQTLSGQILHTIQDFYSHSNWVEMGNRAINEALGTSQFESLPIATPNDNVTCVQNCTLFNATCSPFLTGIGKLFNLNCPIKYFKCSGNIVEMKKLVSGYYSDQKLEDGTSIRKPERSQKCSHGGSLDRDTFKPASGGINKDSGFYLLSPHADLHLKAADLAVNHTAYFFNQIRKRIGDVEFSKFLSIYVSKADLDLARVFAQKICAVRV